MFDRLNDITTPSSSPIKSTDKSIHEEAHWRGVVEETENQHPNPLSSTISGFTLGTPPSSPSHNLHSPIGMQSPSFNSSTARPNQTSSLNTSAARATTIINGVDVPIHPYNPNDTDRQAIQANELRRKAKKIKKAHKGKTLKQVCDEAINLSNTNKWPSIEEFKTNGRYDDTDFQVVNGSLVKLFRFVITPEKGLVCDENDRGPVTHGLMTAYVSAGDSDTHLGDNPVCAAGEFGINAAGKVVYANNKTGHYRVPKETLTETVLPYLGQLLAENSIYVDYTNFFMSDWGNQSSSETSEPEPVSIDSFNKSSSYVNAINNATSKLSAASSSSAYQDTTSTCSSLSMADHSQDSPLRQIGSSNSDGSPNHCRFFRDAFNIPNNSLISEELSPVVYTDSAVKKQRTSDSHGKATPEHKSEHDPFSNHWGNISDIVASSPASSHQVSRSNSPALFSHTINSSTEETDCSSMEVASNHSVDEAENHNDLAQDENWMPSKKLDF